MAGSGEDPGEDERDRHRERGDWFAQQLGRGWREVQPGIYRVVAGTKGEQPIPTGSPSEHAADSDLLEAIKPSEDETEPAEPTRRST